MCMPAKGGRKSQYPIFGSTTGRIAALLLACVARHTALRAPCTASRQRTQKRYIGYFRLPSTGKGQKHGGIWGELQLNTCLSRRALGIHYTGVRRWWAKKLHIISDPIPGGATILGSGLGRDSQIATAGEKKTGAGWPAFEERSFEAFRSYYEYLPKGVVKVEYTVRLNNVGDFSLPPSRVEAMYAPEMFGEAPNARVKVEAVK